MLVSHILVSKGARSRQQPRTRLGLFIGEGDWTTRVSGEPTNSLEDLSRSSSKADVVQCRSLAYAESMVQQTDNFSMEVSGD